MIPIRVLKLGGSLLARADWPVRLRAWVAAQPTAINLAIVGGGELVEAVRGIDRAHAMDARFTHWLCIELLEATLKIASHLLPDWPVISQPSELSDLAARARPAPTARNFPALGYLVQVSAFYSRLTPAAGVPEDWSTTSDALAAWLARQAGADELILFKSVTPPSEATTANDLAELGIVDAALPGIIDIHTALRVVNLTTAGGDDIS